MAEEGIENPGKPWPFGRRLFDPGKKAEQLRSADGRIVLHIVIAARNQQRAAGSVQNRDQTMKTEPGARPEKDDIAALNLIWRGPADQDAAAGRDGGQHAAAGNSQPQPSGKPQAVDSDI
jgi:hypothetical protein